MNPPKIEAYPPETALLPHYKSPPIIPKLSALPPFQIGGVTSSVSPRLRS